MRATAMPLVAFVHKMTRSSKRGLYVAVGEAEICNAVVRQVRMRGGAAWFKSLAAVHDGRQGFKIDDRRLDSVLRKRSANRDDDRNRLANIGDFTISEHRPI